MNIEQQIEEEKVRRLMIWYKGGKAGPLKIDIEIHRRCNLICLSCSRRADDKFGSINDFSKTIEMPLDKWLSIVDQAADIGVMQWHIAGGGDPPMLKEVTFPVLERIKHHGMHGILTTNGTNIRNEHIKFLVDIQWDRIHFSIDGPDAKTHDYLRGVPGTFKRVTDTIRELKRLRDENGQDAPHLNMNTVLSTENYMHIDKQVELAHELGIEYMFVEPLIVYSETGRKLKLSEEQMKEFQEPLKKAQNLAKKYRINSNFHQFDKNLDDQLIKKSSAMHEVVKADMEKNERKNEHPLLSVPCYDPWFHMTVKCDGRVISCDVATDEGDNIKEKTLQDIWYGPYFEKHRKMMMSKNIPTFCAQCNPSHTTQRRRLREEISKEMKSRKKGFSFFGKLGAGV